MSSQERLAIQGAISQGEKKLNSLRLQLKGVAALIRSGLSPYIMLHLDELDGEQLDANYCLLKTAIKEMRAIESELAELRQEV